MKLLLPLVAYYFTTGPWRVMWVKYGYDPRTDPSAKIYQTLDYRVPAAGKNNLRTNFIFLLPKITIILTSLGYI